MILQAEFAKALGQAISRRLPKNHKKEILCLDQANCGNGDFIDIGIPLEGGIAAESTLERITAKKVLSELTVKDLTENPAVPYEEDQVTRIILDDLDMAAYCEIKDGTIAQLREWLLDDGTTGDEMLAAGRGRSLYCGIDRKYA